MSEDQNNRAAPDTKALTDEQAEDAYVIDRLGKLLAGVAIALKGPDLAQHRHSYHDLVEVAEKMVLELELYRATYGGKMAAEQPSEDKRVVDPDTAFAIWKDDPRYYEWTTNDQHARLNFDAGLRAAIAKGEGKC